MIVFSPIAQSDEQAQRSATEDCAHILGAMRSPASPAPDAADTLLAVFRDMCARGGDRDAIVAEGSQLSYRQLWSNACALANAYRETGIGPGARVACHLPNSAEFMVALGAAWIAGAVHVGVDRELTPLEVERVIELTDSALTVSQSNFASLLERGRALAGTAPYAPRPDEPAIIFISSGTTGVPKATIGLHGNLGQRWRRLAGWLQFSPSDTHLAQLPLTHGFGLMMAFAALAGGGRIVPQAVFRAPDALDAIAANRVSVFNGTPAHFRLLMREQERRLRDVRSLRLGAGTAAAFPTALVEQIWEQLAVHLVIMYGSSEGVGVATQDREDILLGSVGRPQPGAAKIFGPAGETLPPGMVGEIAFSRRVYPVKYWNKPAPSEGVDEWFKSGDLGRMDAEGRLYVLGRLSTQIDRGGMKVDPAEVERALLALPAIADAFVCGAPNDILGELVCAYIVPTGGRPTRKEICDQLNASLASFKLPDELRIVDAIPRHSLGKVRRDALKALEANTVVAVTG